MNTEYKVSEEFVVKGGRSHCPQQGEVNVITYNNLDQSILDFNKRIIGLKECEWDDEFWDLRLYVDHKLYIYYTTEDDQYIVYRD
jgi:hypothetical protein